MEPGCCVLHEHIKKLYDFLVKKDFWAEQTMRSNANKLVDRIQTLIVEDAKFVCNVGLGLLQPTQLQKISEWVCTD